MPRRRLETLCKRARELGIAPELAALLEPYVAAVERTERACEGFRWGRRCDGASIVELVPVPAVVYPLGPLVSVTYAARKGRERFAHWEHAFERPRPTLVTDGDGEQLWITGGGYRVTARGIVG